MAINFENFEYIKAHGEELYKSFEPVKCPYFNDLVHFNAQGLEHLKYKRRGGDRIPRDQYMRFKLLHLAPQILRLSRTVQGLYFAKGFERMRDTSATQFVVVDRYYYEFIAVIDYIRVRVIVKRINNGSLYFWSIIPYWGIKSGGVRAVHFGNPEED